MDNKLTPQKLGKCFSKASYYTVMHDGIEHAGYLAFLALLSIFPFLMFVLAIAGAIGKKDIGESFVNQIIKLLPPDIVQTLLPRISEIISGPTQGLLTIAIIGIIWTSSSIVEGVRTILNRAYRVVNPPHYIFRRLLSMAQILIIVFLILIGMFFITFAPTMLTYIQTKLHINLALHPNFGVIRYIISSLVILLAISASYYILPNIKQKFSAVLPGAFIVLLIWLSFAEIFSTYIVYYQQVNIVYGSLAGIILTLLFFYTLAIIYIFGAQFNYFFEKAIGHKIVQKV